MKLKDSPFKVTTEQCGTPTYLNSGGRSTVRRTPLHRNVTTSGTHVVV